MLTKQSSSFLSRSLRLSNRNLFPIYFFSNNPQINKKNKEVYDEVVRSTTALKLALKNLTEAQALSMGMQSQDALRVNLMFIKIQYFVETKESTSF